jgi:hypothetical protein
MHTHMHTHTCTHKHTCHIHTFTLTHTCQEMHTCTHTRVFGNMSIKYRDRFGILSQPEEEEGGMPIRESSLEKAFRARTCMPILWY